MSIFFVILIVVICVVLGLVILVQNPKGGGLAANIGGISNQFMGVKQTTDVLEKGTWIFAAVLALLCILSPVFLPTDSSSRNPLLDKLNTSPARTAPVTPAPSPVTPAPSPVTPAPSPVTPAPATTPGGSN